jgi:hypothetical protein
VGDLVSSFDSIADVMRRALDSMDDDKYFTALKEEDGK